MSAVEAIRAARDAGVEIAIDGNDLLLEASAPPPAELVDRLSRHKAAIIAVLAAPRAWAEGFARLPTMHRLTCRRGVGCVSLTTVAASSTAVGPDKQQLSAGDRLIYLAAIVSGHSLESIVPDCFGFSTAVLVALTADTATIETPTGP